MMVFVHLKEMFLCHKSEAVDLIENGFLRESEKSPKAPLREGLLKCEQGSIELVIWSTAFLLSPWSDNLIGPSCFNLCHRFAGLPFNCLLHLDSVRLVWWFE